MLMHGRIDTDDPQLSKLAFLDSAVAKRELAGSDQRLFDGPELLTASSAKAFGGFEQSFFGLPSGVSNRCTHRSVLPPKLRVSQSGPRDEADVDAHETCTWLKKQKGKKPEFDPGLVAVAVKGCVDGGFHALRCGGRATKVTTSFFGQSGSQVAGACTAVHHLSGCRQTKALLRRFVGLDFGTSFSFGHEKHRETLQNIESANPKGGVV